MNLTATPMKYLDKAMTTLHDMGLVPTEGDGQEAPITALLNQITELQVTGEYPDAGTRSDQVEMARTEWAYEMKISKIPQIEMRRIDITVSFADSPDDILASLIGFIGPTPPTTAGDDEEEGIVRQEGAFSGFGSGWEPPSENFGETE